MDPSRVVSNVITVSAPLNCVLSEDVLHSRDRMRYQFCVLGWAQFSYWVSIERKRGLGPFVQPLIIK